MLCFLVTPVLRFALLPYYRRAVLTGENCVLINHLLHSEKEYIGFEAWLLLTFFICIDNQLGSTHSILTYKEY